MNSKLPHVLLFLIDQTSRISKQYSQKELDSRQLGITVDQWVLLKVIEENEGASQKDLAIKSVRDPASITRTLDILQKKGLIVRQLIPNNRRQYSIHLTDVGKLFIGENMDMINRHRAKSLEGFSQKEIEQFKSFLLRVQENMQ